MKHRSIVAFLKDALKPKDPPVSTANGPKVEKKGDEGTKEGGSFSIFQQCVLKTPEIGCLGWCFMEMLWLLLLRVCHCKKHRLRLCGRYCHREDHIGGGGGRPGPSWLLLDRLNMDKRILVGKKR